MRRPSRRWWVAVLALTAGAAGTMGTTACIPGGGFIAIGTAIDVLPHGFVTITVAGSRYYYHRGVFYRPHRGGFLVVPAPYGAVVEVLPAGYVMILVQRDPYAYYRGFFYAPQAERWIVVRPPIGAFVRVLPPGAVTRRVGPVEYKEYAGVWYRPAIQDGKRGYQVAERPSGG
ncbi:MAG: hypothetical protein JSU98_10895 [Gemmatimonadales bacterium]|jgi:hypothetical protein|nr:MAG: hypothetical protein JSU98_10895 [Gemmatimonadales bacterium]